MTQLLNRFDANEAKYAHRAEVVTAISGWAAQWVAGVGESYEELYSMWSAEAAALGLEMPSLEDMVDALTDAESVYKFFGAELLGYGRSERVVYAKEGSLVTLS